MRCVREIATTIACCLVIGLCAVVAGRQVLSFGRHFVTWQRQREPIPRFGQVEVVYFYEPTCPACKVSSPTVLHLRRRYPRYRIARVNTVDSAGIELMEEYTRAYGVPAGLQSRIPVAFAGRRYFVGVEAITRDLPAHLRAGPLAPAPRRPLNRESGSAILHRRFQSLSVAPILLAGLVDGINPCAIATLIFYLSYLTWVGRRPRDLLWIGSAFTLGVFLTYLFIGLGVLQVLRSFQAVPFLARALYPAAALVTFSLALLSFLDYRQSRGEQSGRMVLQLPQALKRKLHAVIRSQLGLRQMVAAAFATAAAVSALEFTCTSQVYLPTLMYMAQAGQQRLRATALLGLYNLMFVLPLIVLFVAAYCGMSSRQMARLAVRHMSTAKLLMSLLFVGFTLYLCAISVRLFAST